MAAASKSVFTKTPSGVTTTLDRRKREENTARAHTHTAQKEEEEEEEEEEDNNNHNKGWKTRRRIFVGTEGRA